MKAPCESKRFFAGCHAHARVSMLLPASQGLDRIAASILPQTRSRWSLPRGETAKGCFNAAGAVDVTRRRCRLHG